MTGFFGVRIYKEGTPIDNRKIKAEDEQIDFNVTFDHLPEQFSTFAKNYKNKDGEDRWRVTFKIGANAHWYDGKAQPMSKPLNTDLDAHRWDVRIQGVELVPEDLNGKTARGYWVNAIQVSEHVDNPFTAFSGGVAMTPDKIMAAEEVLPEDDKGGEDLPF